MKWLREFSTQYISGVGVNEGIVSFQNSDHSWKEDYFTIFPLTDGVLSIRAFAKSTASPAAGTTFIPSDNLSINYRERGSVTWSSLTFSGTTALLGSYVVRQVSLSAGVPVELKGLTGLTRVVRRNDLIGYSDTIFPGKISTNCPALIMGQLQSLVVGGVNTQGTPGDPSSSVTIPWQNYLNGVRSLFSGWSNLLDASNLILISNIASTNNTPDFTELFSGCTNLISGPTISAAGGNYTEFFKDCMSLRSIYANLNPSARVTYTLTDWLKGTNLGDRKLYVPDTLDSSYDLCIPENDIGQSYWETVSIEFN